AVAITVANVTTTADLGTAGATPLSITGAFSARATHTGSADTQAKADAAGAKAAIGASLALNVINDTTTATTARDLSAGGAVTFQAHSAESGSATAAASASGAQPDSTGTTDPAPA